MSQQIFAHVEDVSKLFRLGQTRDELHVRMKRAEECQLPRRLKSATHREEKRLAGVRRILCFLEP